MALEDSPDLAQIGIRRIAEIAIILGTLSREPTYASLGTELWLVADYLSSTDPDDDDEELRSRTSKLLRHVEKICSWPMRVPTSRYPLLEAIAQEEVGSQGYKRAQKQVQQGLQNLVSKTNNGDEAILRLKRIVERGNIKRHNVDEDIPMKSRKDRPVDPHPSEIHDQVYGVLREHMCCTCNGPVWEDHGRRSHLARLMLRPLLQNMNDDGQVQFDMLFSSSPAWGEQFDRWQDVELLVPQAQKKQKKPNRRARFPGDGGCAQLFSSTESAIGVIGQGKFCELVKVDTGSRVRLAIQDGKLQRYRSDFLKQMVQHVPGISLASILKNYHVSAKVKAVLAYILAQSVWQYYDSDWMKTRWTSESIQFIKERGSSIPSDQGQLFPSRPYLSVHFGDEDPWSGEYSAIEGEIHHYPRIRALGIMLVEIGIGSPLPRRERRDQAQSLAASANEDLLLAIQCLNNDRLWIDFEYSDYHNAAKDCLDPGTFVFTPQSGGTESLEGVKQRRDILYEKVVSRLKELLEGTKWMEQLTQNKIGPLDTSVGNTPVQQVARQSLSNVLLEQQVNRKSKKAHTENEKNEKAAREWLSRMQRLSRMLAATPGMAPSHSSARIRIAILDTGCDDDSIFFHLPHNLARLKEWKDYVGGSEEWVDNHGHGTHLASLIMKIATEADVYVARVAAGPNELSMASENVAKAISWASKEWKADIISMSFGYAEEQQCISNAILDALNHRHGSILFFAAASNFGANQREMFPASHDSVISIQATNANGHSEDFNPPENENETAVFGTLGLAVPGAWLSHHNGEKYQSGTSVATAIAAGIAGVLLGYVNSRAKVGEMSDATLQSIKNKIRTRRGILDVFKDLSTKPLSNQKLLYLTPWQLIDKSEDEGWIRIAAVLLKI